MKRFLTVPSFTLAAIAMSACGGGHTAPNALPGQAHHTAPQATPPRLRAVTAAWKMESNATRHLSRVSESWMQPDGTVITGGVVDGTPESIANPGFVAAIDPSGAERWIRRLPHGVNVVAPLEGGRSVAIAWPSFSLTTDTPVSFLGAQGAVERSTSLDAWIGVRCGAPITPIVTRDDRGGFSMHLLCASLGDVSQRITAQGTAAERTPTERVGKPAPDGSQWAVEPRERGFSLIRRAPGQPIWSTPLAAPTGPRSFLGGRWANAEIVPDVDGTIRVAAAFDELVQGPPSDHPVSRVRSRSLIARVDPRAQRSREIWSTIDGRESPRVLLADRAPDHALVALIAYTPGTTIGGVELPVWSSPFESPFADMIPRWALVTFDPATDEPREVAVIVPGAEGDRGLTRNVARQLLISEGQVVVRFDYALYAFSRTASAPMPAEAPAISEAPIRSAPPPKEIAAAVITTDAWQSVCSAATKQKQPAPCELTALATGPDGTVYAGGGYYENNAFAGQALPKQAFETGVLAAVDASGKTRWLKHFGVSWHNLIDDALVLDDGRLVVVGSHAQGFDAGGKRLPDRVVPKNHEFAATADYLAIYRPDGTLDFADDVDAMLYGNTSTSPERSCSARLYRAGGGDYWLRSDACPDTVLARMRGSSIVERRHHPVYGSSTYTTHVSEDVDAGGKEWSLRVASRVVLLHSLDTATQAAATIPLSEPAVGSAYFLPYGERIALHPAGGVVVAAMPQEVGEAGADVNGTAPVVGGQLVVSRVDGSGRISWQKTLTTVAGNAIKNAKLKALTIDGQGRAVIMVSYADPVTIGGSVLTPAPLSDGTLLGNALVRVSSDGERVEVFPLQAKPGECANPGFVASGRLAAGAKGVYLLGEFGVVGNCGHSAPTTVFGIPLP